MGCGVSSGMASGLEAGISSASSGDLQTALAGLSEESRKKLAESLALLEKKDAAELAAAESKKNEATAAPAAAAAATAEAKPVEAASVIGDSAEMPPGCNDTKQAKEAKKPPSGNEDAPDGSLVQKPKEKTKRSAAEEDAANIRYWSNQSEKEEHYPANPDFPGKVNVKNYASLVTRLMLDFRDNKAVLKQREHGWDDESDGEGYMETRSFDRTETFTGTWYEARDLTITCDYVSDAVECTSAAGNRIATFEVPPEEAANMANGLYGEWLVEKLSEVLGRDPGLRLVLMKGSGEIFWNEITEAEATSAGQIVLLFKDQPVETRGRITLDGNGYGWNNGVMSRVDLTDNDAVLSPFTDPVIKGKVLGKHFLHFSKLHRERKT